jgi:AMMECR1 domain-containing protein
MDPKDPKKIRMSVMIGDPETVRMSMIAALSERRRTPGVVKVKVITDLDSVRVDPYAPSSPIAPGRQGVLVRTGQQTA